MNEIDLQKIIDEFEKTINVKLDFSNDNLAEVIFDKKTTVGIKVSKDDGTIILSSVIADELPDPLSDKLATEILNLNSVPGINYGGNAPVIARDKLTGFIFVYEIITASLLNSTSLFNIFSDFVKYKLVLSELFNSSTSDASNTLNNCSLLV